MENKVYKFVDSNDKIWLTQDLAPGRDPSGTVGDKDGNPIVGEWKEMTRSEFDAFMAAETQWMLDNPHPPEAEPTAEEKLKNAGLTVDELKGLLGL